MKKIFRKLTVLLILGLVSVCYLCAQIFQFSPWLAWQIVKIQMWIAQFYPF